HNQPSHTVIKAPRKLTHAEPNRLSDRQPLFTQHFIFFTRLAIQIPIPRQTTSLPKLSPSANRHNKATEPNGQSHSYPQCQRSKANLLFSARISLRRGACAPANLNELCNRSHSITHRCLINIIGSGGANRDRTGDLLLAKQALSQLSYGPGIQR